MSSVVTTLTPEELEAELVVLFGFCPEYESTGPEGNCPRCIGVTYTGSPLCSRHQQEARA